MTRSAILVESLAYAYPHSVGEARWVFENVTLEVRPGEIVCLVGPSGCGKSTLLNLIAGFLTPAKGSISVAPTGQISSSKVGYIFQRDALLPWRTVRGNLLLAGEITGGRIPEGDDISIRDYLKVFGLDETVLAKFPAELSGGMRQRISIVQSLMAEPNIFLLDEPFSSLDFYTKLRLEAEFRAMISGRGKAALFVTHDIDEAIAVGDRILIMGASPRGILDAVTVQFDSGDRLSPEAIRGHAKFGEYFSRVWKQLRDSI